MQIRSLFFASYRDLVGSDSLALEMPDGANVADLVRQIRVDTGISELPESPVVAINMEYASLSAPLCEGDEVAFIPPVAGG